MYVDHRTETTSWERPRSRPTRKFKFIDPQLAWTARLQAPLPGVPESSTKSAASGSLKLFETIHGPQIQPSGVDLIAELVRDGYVLGDASTDFSSSGSVPDFWEVYQGSDGYTYYINHPAGNILRSIST